MRKRIVFVLLLLFLVGSGVYSALALTSIDWTKFNSETASFYYCPRTYDVSKGSFTFTIHNQLVYNSSTSDAKAIIAFAPSTTDTTNKLEFVYFGNGAFDLNWKGSKVFGSTWTAGQVWTVTLSEIDDVNTRIYIKEGNTLKWDGEVTGQFKIAVFGASGVPNSVTDGTVDVEFGAVSGDTLIDMDLLTPIITTIVSISIVVAIIEKVTKKVKQ